MSELKLVSKLADVMKEVKYIEKKGFNKFHKYKYATEADVADKIREVLAEKNVLMVPNMKSHNTREHTTANGKTEYIVTVEMEFTFYDGETGEKISYTIFGEGQDAGDKGTYKAITGAQKYALLKVFLIPTGDDPEQDEGTDERNNSQPQENLVSSKQVGLIKVKVKELASSRGKEEAEIYKHLGFEDVTKLTSSQASDAIKTLEKWSDQAKQPQRLRREA